MRYFLPLAIATLLLSCESTTENQGSNSHHDSVAVSTTAPVLKNGTMNDLTVVSDPSNSYTVYLPANYDATKRWPVIVFFDAHADGHLPLDRYKSLAEKWGYVLVGSNTSKNGMDMEITMRIGNELVDEVKNLVSADEDHILLCGFSGGARVASVISEVRNDVKGVICNSAAPRGPLKGKVFVGIAGLGDMNYLEMKKFVDNQPENKMPHELVVFDGKHEWAPARVMEDAFLVATIHDTTGRTTSMDSLMAKTLAVNIVQQADSIKKTSCMLAQKLLDVGRHACTPYKAWGSGGKFSVDNSCVKSDEAAWTSAEQEESRLQEELGNAVLQQDTTWWKANADKYFETTKSGPEKFMRQRLRGYISLMCYSYANQAMEVKNMHAAEKMVAVYSIVDPTNSEWAYMRATLYMRLGMNEYALAMLDKAVSIGFNDRNRLMNDPTFGPLQTNPQFSEVINKMK